MSISPLHTATTKPDTSWRLSTTYLFIYNQIVHGVQNKRQRKENENEKITYTVSQKKTVVSNFLRSLHQLLTDVENYFTVGNNIKLSIK